MRRILAVLLSGMMALFMAIPYSSAESDTFTMLYAGEVTTLNYLITATTNEFSLASNLIDTLVEHDRFGQVLPSLAETWVQSDDGLVWTFRLREGVKWVDGKGSPVANVTAHDFVAAARYILDAANAASTANILYEYVEGAEDYYLGTSEPEEGEEPAPPMEWDTVGIRALDDLTLEYTLITPVPYFLSMLPYVCFMPAPVAFLEEKGDEFGLATGNDTLLYCGAYYLSEFSPQERRVLTKNTQNWDADNILIETLLYQFNAEATTVGPEMYLRGEVDVVDEFSSAIATEWLSDPEKADFIRPERRISFYSYFYGFNFDPQFDDVYEPENWL
ncbi:MAG: ABC transporter substrate-binding protein, partial [Clostridia bacterium]|nr:ABC transporter substrate-binding protein [Clostridia bacterium]